MRALGWFVSVWALAASAQSPVPEGTFQFQSKVVVVIQKDRSEYLLTGLMEGRPIRLAWKDNALIGRAGLFKPVRVEFSKDSQVATIFTRESSRDFKRLSARDAAVGHPAIVALNLIRSGRWGEAKEPLRKVVEGNPRYGGGMFEEYLLKCAEEIPNEEKLDRAQVLVTAGQFDEAEGFLSQVTATTVQTERRDKIAAQLKEGRANAGRVSPMPSPTEELERLSAIDKQANDRISAGRWTEARILLTLLKKSDATYGGRSVDQRLADCNREAPNEQRLNKAELFLERGDLGNAANELSRVTHPTVQSVRRERLVGQLRMMRQAQQR